MTDAAESSTTVPTIHGWMDRYGALHPDKIFIHSIEQDSSITYGEALDLFRRMAAKLRIKRYGANDRVALLSGNSIEHLIAYLGVMYYGATICTIHTEMNATILTELLAAVAPGLVLTADGIDVEGLGALPASEVVALGEWRHDNSRGFIGDVVGRPASAVAPPVNAPEDVASIFYTSGTTSKPKGILCRFRDLEINVAETAAAFGISGDDRILDYRSFNWMSAQTLSALGALCTGATLVFARNFSRSNFFDWIRGHEITIAAGNPTIINMLINSPIDLGGAPPQSLRFLTSSSAPLLVQNWNAFEALYGIRIAQGYGASETGWISASDAAAARLGAVGRPLAYHDLAIVDSAGQRLPPSQVGEIEVGGDPERPYLYLGDDGRPTVNAVGRIRTGDLGYLDEDGYLFITGREKDVIVRGGVNISPVEIDDVINRMPGVAEAATVGVPDEIYGEEVVAFVVPAAQYALSADGVIDFCRQNLAPQKTPKTVIIRNDLPNSDRGKLDRKRLAEIWLESHAGGAGAEGGS